MHVGRRALVKGAGASLALALLAACGAGSGSTGARPVLLTPGTMAQAPGGPALPPLGGGRLLGYAFNTTGKDVTIFDPQTRTALETRPLGATVRWLSNEQRFWDGRVIWTYDFPNNELQAIAIDPRAVAVTRTLPIGKGIGHSLMLTPDRKTAWINAADGDYLAALDVASGQTIAQVKTGKYP